MSNDEAWTVLRLLSWTTEYLGKHGSDSPRLDAEVLLAQSLDCPRIELYTRFGEEPGEETKAAFRDLVRRRAEGMPVAYLVGHREFFSLDFQVTPDVLIPRPETEDLVVAAIDLAKGAQHNVTVCDVGTGSGIIAVSMAKQLPGCRVTAVDICGKALEVAKANATTHGVCDQIEFLLGDLFAPVPADRTFDLVLSNPPYVADGETNQMAPETLRFEPRGALFAGPQGTEVIERLVAAAPDRLEPGGHLLVEISPMIHDAVRDIVQSSDQLVLGETIKDLAGHHRVVVAQRA